MSKGLDAPVDCSHAAQAIKDAGYEFVGRYYSHTHSKNLTHAEAKVLSAHGLSCVAVWETAGDKPDHFTHARGIKDANSAHSYAHNMIEQPQQTPIYYAVDFDASPADIKSRIIPYFKGIQDSDTHPPFEYAVGAYGSGLVLESLLNAHLITYAWLAMATGWRGSRTFHR